MTTIKQTLAISAGLALMIFLGVVGGECQIVNGGSGGPIAPTGQSNFLLPSGTTTLNCFGDSLTAGSGNTTTWCAQVGSTLGISTANTGVLGAKSIDPGVAGNIFGGSSCPTSCSGPATITNTSLSGLFAGVNDMRANLTAAQYLNYQQAIGAELVYLAIPTAQIQNVNTSNTNITLGGSWTNLTSSAFGNGAFGGNATTITWTPVGTTLYIIPMLQAGSTCTWTLTIDSASYGTFANVFTSWDAQTTMGALLRFPGLADGPHTVVITNTSATNCAFLDLASNRVLSGTQGVNYNTGPYVYVNTIPRETSTGYNGNGSDTAVQTIDQNIRQIAAQLTSDGLNVAVVDTTNWINPATDLQADGIHFTDAGQIKDAQAWLDAMSRFSQTKFRPPVVVAAPTPLTIQVASDFTTAANTNLQTITGLTWNVPALTKNYSFHCDLTYSQATANAAVAFGIQAATNAPTAINASGQENTSLTAYTTGTLRALASTTATAIVSATPSAFGAIGTASAMFRVELSGTIENPFVPNTINIMVSTATSGDAVTVYRGSGCFFTSLN